MRNALLCFGMCLSCFLSQRVARGDLTITFDELAFAAGSDFFNGSSGSGGFTSQGAFFNNRYSTAFGTWSGWSYSRVNNSTTAGFANQYAAITRTGVGGSGSYAVAYDGSPFDARPIINLPVGHRPGSVSVTNTTYAALYMRDGLSPPFNPPTRYGGANGNSPDFFTVNFTGYAELNAAGATTGSVVSVNLADYRFANNTLDYVLTTWLNVDLAMLGNARSIGLSFSSSDIGQFGINTPTYVAIDSLNLTAVPEPHALVLVVLACGGLLVYRLRFGARAAIFTAP